MYTKNSTGNPHDRNVRLFLFENVSCTYVQFIRIVMRVFTYVYVYVCSATIGVFKMSGTRRYAVNSFPVGNFYRT